MQGSLEFVVKRFGVSQPEYNWVYGEWMVEVERVGEDREGKLKFKR